MLFPALQAVRAEVQWLDHHLRNQNTVPIGRIGRVWVENGQVMTSISAASQHPQDVEPVPQRGSFRRVLSDMFAEKEPWHLVHYAGHSHYADKLGYLVLPHVGSAADDDAEPDYVGSSDFARWLRRTRFMYLSSCRGSSQGFVYDLCKQRVPAVAGFRWNIDDDKAQRHSQTFYEELFATRSIEAALFAAWNHMYGRHRKNPVWAASQLVLQLAA
jgi:hypothetical protein